MDNLEAKIASVAEIIQGRIIHDEKPLEVYIKGKMLGFPAIFEALRVNFPFGVTYFIETNVIEDPSRKSASEPLKLTITPRLAKGFLSFITRIFILEGKGQKLDISAIDSTFVCTFNSYETAKRLLGYPGMQDKLLELNKYTKFRELIIKSDVGLYLSQPMSFVGLDLDVYKETFRIMAEIGQILAELFNK